MPVLDVVEFDLVIAFGENHSPVVKRDDRARNSYYDGRTQMYELERLAHEHGGLGALNEREPQLSKSGQMMGGGPFMNYLATLNLSFATLTALAFLRAARPIVIEYLKNRRGSFKFRHGDLALECEGVGCFDKIKEHLEKLEHDADVHRAVRRESEEVK